jgi:hypothetical protein
MFRSSLAGRTSLFASFPSPSYWATFTKSLRDESSAHTPKPYVDADEQPPGGGRITAGPRRFQT